IEGQQLPSAQVSMPTFGDELLKLPPCVIPPGRDNAYAVVIGIEKYRDITPSQYAVADAQLVRDYLTKAMGFSEENVMYAINERASKNDLKKYFEVWLKNRVDSNSTVIIYYSGHGAPNPLSGESFIVPYDGDPNVIEDTGYPLKNLYDSLNKLPCDKILVVLDSCFSGAGGPRTVLAKGTRPIVVTMKDAGLEGSKIAVLSAASGGQISGTYDEKQHGLFTYYFLRELLGEADKDKDKKIYLSELYEYLKPEVIKKARSDYREQEPQLLPSAEHLGEWSKIPLEILK
ncbi:MAG: caspase family protein, partial [Elusimicrobiota bacterium]